jgi:hypothetical protein
MLITRSVTVGIQEPHISKARDILKEYNCGENEKLRKPFSAIEGVLSVSEGAS